jgi:hypothetical protein
MSQPIFISATLYAKKPRKPTKKGPGKAGVDFVLAEGWRSPWASQHVAEIRAPTIVWSRSAADIQSIHDERLNKAFTMTVGRVRRCIRPDQCTLLAVVASYRGDPKTVLSDPVLRADYEKWEQLATAFLQRTFDTDLEKVIRHTDEANIHLHGYVVPGENDFEMRARALHPGHAVEDRVMALALAEGRTKKLAADAGRVAYKKALSAFLDDFYLQVGLPCGHMRHGSMKKRRQRADIMAERRAAEGIELANRHRREIVSAAYDNGLHRGLADADEQKLALHVAAEREAESIKAEAERWAEEAKEQARLDAAKILKKARDAADQAAQSCREEAAQELAAARKERAAAALFGDRVGTFMAHVTGATGRIREEMASGAKVDQTRDAARIDALRDDGADLRRQIHALEKKLAASNDWASQVRLELERLQSQDERGHFDHPEVWTPPKF